MSTGSMNNQLTIDVVKFASPFVEKQKRKFI